MGDAVDGTIVVIQQIEFTLGILPEGTRVQIGMH